MAAAADRGVRLVSVLSDNLQHAGQAAYLRGLFQGKGMAAVLSGQEAEPDLECS